MKFKSTRSHYKTYSFEEALFSGYTEDSGLLIPEKLPFISLEQLKIWNKYNFQQLTLEILSLFISENEITKENLKNIIDKSFENFSYSNIIPIQKINNSIFIAELFHGPTLSFKDIALGIIGNLFEYFLTKRNKKVTILVATSGDTGSAAIYGIKGKKNIECFVLYPLKRISYIQEIQMTTILDNNIHVIGIEGTSDDLDEIIKILFSDLSFKKKYNLCSINSINIGRILIQIVNYFYCYFYVREQILTNNNDLQWPKIIFSIPTGAFGNGVAGVLSKLMGLPIKKLIIATNENGILSQFYSKGLFKKEKVIPTISPSIDIQIPYNFERFLFYMCNENANKVKKWMETFEEHGKIEFNEKFMNKVKKYIWSVSITSNEITQTIQKYYTETNYLFDPHTAVGIKAIEKYQENIKEKQIFISFATAHPGKFGETISKIISKKIENQKLLELLKKPTKCILLENDKDITTKLKTMIINTFL